ncbi:MAG TPA: hypothetical protein VN363_10005 [Anaerolineales bacterium]|nr:hypothetical protein [Anaerolineales bacterium]
MQYPKRILAAAIVLALVTASCSITEKLSSTSFKTGPTQEIAIQVPLPQAAALSAGAGDVSLTLDFVAGVLKLAPADSKALTAGSSGNLASGDSALLASGLATFNVAEFAPIVASQGSAYTVKTGDMKIKGIPKFADDLINIWDLQLASTPMSLKILAGGYSGCFELGGLALQNLEIEEGGSQLTSAFSAPNQVEMESLLVSSGGSNMTLTGLANANFARMTLSAGAGTYTLSFDGELQRAASVAIDIGASTVNLTVPDGVSASLTFNGGLSSVNAGAGWELVNNVYTHPGRGPALTISVEMGVGTLNLNPEG